jgi:hypothetical protein
MKDHDHLFIFIHFPGEIHGISVAPSVLKKPTLGSQDESEDQGIQTAEDSRFFGLSAGFDSFSNAGKDRVQRFNVYFC